MYWKFWSLQKARWILVLGLVSPNPKSIWNGSFVSSICNWAGICDTHQLHYIGKYSTLTNVTKNNEIKLWGPGNSLVIRTERSSIINKIDYGLIKRGLYCFVPLCKNNTVGLLSDIVIKNHCQIRYIFGLFHRFPA